MKPTSPVGEFLRTRLKKANHSLIALKADLQMCKPGDVSEKVLDVIGHRVKQRTAEIVAETERLRVPPEG